jgi:hypothetical protein
MKKRHKQDSKTFGELSFADQARSVSATILQLEKAINARCHHPEATAATKTTCVNQVARLLVRLTADK